MGAVLDPTPDMAPWWAVESRTESAYLSATVYVPASLRHGTGAARRDVQPPTEEEHAGAWLAAGAWDTLAPGPVAALLAALDQVLTHPNYERWTAAGGTPLPESITAELRGGRVLLTAPLIRYEEELDGGHFAHAELGYEYAAPLRAAVAALAA
ncbi:hypothetical protein ACF09H_29800 [Streptomyces sp. NPDC014983]|uniref:hypothetical protein n=1 Tax=Streptomyces sp. NPDC014983 TaxID=3364933 RepID=UPI0037020649